MLREQQDLRVLKVLQAQGTGSSEGVNVNYVASSTSTSNRGTFGAGVHSYQGYSTGSNRPFTYDTTLQCIAGVAGFEISIDWLSTTRTPMKIRSLRDCCQGWSEYTTIFNNKEHLLPAVNNTYDLGSTSFRFRNLYINDLQLSNEAKKDEGGNNVDGTWGDWTLQEGENDIFMINNRTGKKFKIKMEEVD